MSRCFCPCHSYPGVYPPPCGACGHDTREGRMVGGYRDGWEPIEVPDTRSLLGALQIAVGTLMLVRSADRLVEKDRIALEGMRTAVKRSGLPDGSFRTDAALRAIDGSGGT